MYILDSNQYARDPHGISGKLNDTIEKLGGEVLVSRLWSEQKLAYPIGNHRKGTYWITYFRIDGGRLSELNNTTRLNESILRSMVLKIDPRLVEAMVAHARGETVAAPAAEEPAAAE
jgi:small subunit ribosomal protein S6